MLIDRESTCINTLLARGVRKDEPAVRLGLSNLLERADLKPPGLPPSAILIVKRIPDPRPGALAASLNRIQPDREWERAVREQLDRYYRCAARPHKGVIPEDAEAVVFQDDAELRACLCIDLADGTAGRRWWWKASLRRLPAAAGRSLSVATVLGEAPAIVPAVLTLLHNWRFEETVLTAVEPADAVRVTGWVAGEYGLHNISDVVTGRSSAAADHGAYEGDGTSAETREQPAPRHARSPSRPRGIGRRGVAVYWNRYLGGEFVPAGLEPEQAFLCGLAVLLQRQPWRLRAPECHEVLKRLWSESGDVLMDELPDVSSLTDRPADVAEPYRQGGDDGRRPPADIRDDSAMTSSDPARSDRPDHGMAGEDSAERTVIEDDVVSNAPLAADKQQREAPAAEAATVPQTGMEAMTTDIGGVLYLINLMTALDLPGCFEKGWNLTGYAGPWGVLEVLARALFEAIEDDSVTDDPLWTLLARLDGRGPDESPGAGLAAADEYRLPPAWFEAITSGREGYYWSSARGRIRLWSTAGYLLVDIPYAGRDVNRRVKRELHAYTKEWRVGRVTKSANNKAPLARYRFADRCGLSAGMKAWLARVMPYVQYRLLRAAGDDAAAFLGSILYCRAEIYAGSSHVDLVTPLDNISMIARSSGLDRDPGWLPGFGRVVHFHFE